ncbi:MAG TPA: esterase family protein [Clostridiales bacterium]|nr:esterase family protein [Clostridiales bacterium]
MAYFNCHFFSSILKQNVTLDVLIPSPDSDELMNKDKMRRYNYRKGFPILYLLHGAYGDYSDWQRFTGIEKHAQKYHIAVVMASAGNSFYHNMVRGQQYHTFFTEELRQFVTDMFPVSSLREDTFVAGLSMGGYGAFYLALSRPDLYSHAASVSGALDIVKLYEEMGKGEIEGPFPWEDIFEEPENLQDSEADLYMLLERCKKGKDIPKLYQACGTEDFLYEINRAALSRFRELGTDITYEEGSGIHDWNFWDSYIQKVLRWLPAGDNQ